MEDKALCPCSDRCPEWVCAERTQLSTGTQDPSSSKLPDKQEWERQESVAGPPSPRWASGQESELGLVSWIRRSWARYKPKPELGHLLTQVRVHLHKPVLMSSRKIFLVLSVDKGRAPLLKLVPCPSLTVSTLRACAPAGRSGPLVFASALGPHGVCPHALSAH